VRGQTNYFFRGRRRQKAIGLLCLGLSAGKQGVSLTCAQVQPPAYDTSIQVSPTGSDSDTCGSGEAPCQTIQQGIYRCAASKSACAVFVRYGSYSLASPVNLANGVDVYGSCVFDESDPRYRTIATGSPAFAANGINTKTLLDGFVIVGADATQPGQASIAMTVTNSSGLTIHRSILASGKGGDGFSPAAVDGTSGEGGSGPRLNTGGGGGRACAANPTSIGMGGQGADFQQVYSYTCWLLLVSCGRRSLCANTYTNNACRHFRFQIDPPLPARDLRLKAALAVS
jgi:hypothetical protein